MYLFMFPFKIYNIKDTKDSAVQDKFWSRLGLSSLWCYKQMCFIMITLNFYSEKVK